MNMATADLYGTMDPFQRATSSPKRRGTSNESNNDDTNIFSYEYPVNNIFYCKYFFRFFSKQKKKVKR